MDKTRNSFQPSRTRRLFSRILLVGFLCPGRLHSSPPSSPLQLLQTGLFFQSFSVRLGAVPLRRFDPIAACVEHNSTIMAPSLSLRPRTSDRPPTRDQSDLIIPSRTSSLHSRITQPMPSTLSIKPAQRSPKTLTHAYMVCGVGREPSQWVKAPPPSQGKIGHMKGAVSQFWLPEILGSSPRLEQDNDIARSLHAAMRVSGPSL